MMSTLETSQVERFRQLYEQEQADSKWIAYIRDNDERRVQARAEMLELLSAFLRGDVSNEEFRATFQRNTRLTWKVFGLNGTSGAMLLNEFVKYVPDQDALAELLRDVLPAPDDVSTGQDQLSAIVNYSRELLATHVVRPLHLQVGHIPFFISAWWHIQSPERWPVYYVSGRQALQDEGLFNPRQDPVTDYFTFRGVFLALMSALGLSSWALEHLLAWFKEPNAFSHSDRAQLISPSDVELATSIEEAAEVQPPATPQQVTAHTQVQLLLAQIGKQLGCDIWIAANDQGRQVNGSRLGDLSIRSLPSLGLNGDVQKIISLIDVLWLKGTHQVVAAFEIEHTTSIYSGLLRLSDLVAMSPNVNFAMYIVSPEVRLSDVGRELSRPTFQTLGLHERCGFFSEEKLQASAEGIMTWADSPNAIRRLAHYVGDVSSGETE